MASAPGAAVDSSPNHEKDNYIRLSALLIDGVSKLLREVFTHKCPNGLQKYLGSHKASIELSRLQPDQRAILYPADGSQAKLEDCDVTLLLMLFDRVLNVRSGRAVPLSSASQLERDLMLFRIVRNGVLAHVPKLRLHDDEFERHWSDITLAMERCAKIIGRESVWQAEIRKYYSAALTTEEEQYVRRLEEWYETEKGMREICEQVLDEVHTLGGKCEVNWEQILGKFEETNQNIKEVQTTQKILLGRVSRKRESGEQRKISKRIFVLVIICDSFLNEYTNGYTN